MEITIPINFLHSNATFSVPKSPNISIRYATINCEITISITALAGPKLPMLFITVKVIKAPITPPNNIYFGCVCNKPEKLFLPVTNHPMIQTKNALNCTQLLETHILVFFVTSVLKTPCMLIKAPESSAMKRPNIPKTSLSSIFHSLPSGL